jgi:hypothetical protein
MKIIKYDTEKYNFREVVQSVYGCDLDSLDSEDAKLNLTLGNDTKTELHKKFYEKVDSGWDEFQNLYLSFVKDVIHPMFEDDTLIYQTLPGIRFCRPGAKAVYKWHSDGDPDHKHPLGEVNIILPLTKCFDTNSIWVESIPGMGDFEPLTMEYGEFFIGYLNQCRHGNLDNETGKTRVSFDFRVVPGFAYDPECTLETCTTKSRFVVGGYYEKITREETPYMYDAEENAKRGAAC